MPLPSYKRKGRRWLAVKKWEGKLTASELIEPNWSKSYGSWTNILAENRHSEVDPPAARYFYGMTWSGTADCSANEKRLSASGYTGEWAGQEPVDLDIVVRAETLDDPTLDLRGIGG